MKLSELSTDQVADVLCELSPYVDSIASDNEVVDSVGKVMEDGQDLNLYGKVMLLAGRVGKFVPILLKTHRADVYGILSVMNDQPVAEIAAQKFTDTMKQVRELFNDEEFFAFFKSSAQREQSEQSAPSAGSHA